MSKQKLIAILIVCVAVFGYGGYRIAKRVLRPTPDARIQRLVNYPAPAWNVPSQYWINTPKPLQLNDVKGHITLIEFFRIECPHCKDAAPFVKELLDKYGDRGLKVVAFHSPGKSANENDWKKVKAKLREWKVSYPVAFDEKASLFKKSYNGSHFPSVVVLDKEGVIRFAQTGLTDDKAVALKKFLATTFGRSSK